MGVSCARSGAGRLGSTQKQCKSLLGGQPLTQLSVGVLGATVHLISRIGSVVRHGAADPHDEGQRDDERRDYLRRRVRQNRLHLVQLENAAEAVSLVGDPPAQLIKDENEQAVYRALTELPYEQREVITLHLNGDMTLGEIARLQGVSINTIKSRYRYGLVKMRSILREGNTYHIPISHVLLFHQSLHNQYYRTQCETYHTMISST